MKTHELDQMIAGLRDVAILTKEFHNKLIEQGFTKEEALTIVAKWATSMLTGKK